MPRTRHTDEEKARIIREFENYQGSTVAFCRQLGISCQTFTNWRRRATANLPNPEQAPAFIEFELGAAHHRPAPVGPIVELELGGGMVLRIHPARPAQP
ncbi:MAG: Transposase [Verrucomicrobiota bacterium]|jgi:transposase-like protein